MGVSNPMRVSTCSYPTKNGESMLAGTPRAYLKQLFTLICVLMAATINTGKSGANLLLCLEGFL